MWRVTHSPTFPSLNSNCGTEPFFKRNVLSSDDFRASSQTRRRARRHYLPGAAVFMIWSLMPGSVLVPRRKLCFAVKSAPRVPGPPQNKTLMEIKSCTVWYRSSSLKLDKVNADDSTFCFFKYLYIPFYHSYHIFSQVILQLCNFNRAVKKKHYTIFFSTIFFPTGE